MTAALRKATERQRRKERGEVALSGWLSAEDHAALTQMAREAGMTQAQVVGRLIGMRAAVLGLERRDMAVAPQRPYFAPVATPNGYWVRHSDIMDLFGVAT